MNPDVFNNPEKFLFPLIQARQAEQDLKDKLLDVQDDFAIKQAALGWLLDNPWLFALFLQREVSRIETPVFIRMKAELEACNSGETMRALVDEVTKLREENERLKAFPQKLYDAVTKNICDMVFQDPLENDEKTSNLRKDAFKALNKMFIDAGAPTGMKMINDCPTAQSTTPSTGSNSGGGVEITTPTSPNDPVLVKNVVNPISIFKPE